MYRYKKVVVVAVIMAMIATSTYPRRADAIIPGIAAAAAALGCSEGTLVAVGGGLLAAGGIIANGENEKVKAVSAAVAGLGSAALERLSAAVNAVGPGGVYTLPIDQYLAQDIADMVANVENVANSGEGIEMQEFGEETVITHPFGEITLHGGEGIVACLANLTVVPSLSQNYEKILDVRIKGSVKNSGITVKANYVHKAYTESGQHECRLSYNVYKNGSYVTGWVRADTIMLGTAGTYNWDIEGEYDFNDITFGAAVGGGTAAVFFDGTMVYDFGDVGTDYGLKKITGTGYSAVPNEFMYSLGTYAESYLTPGVDYTNAGLTPEQIAALAGTTITGNVVNNVYNPPTINQPVTWPEATDLTGVIGGLANVWNAINQGFASVKAYLAQIVASISTTLDPNIIQEPINNLKTFIVGKVPELPDLDTSGFADREWNWSVTINHPWNITFEVLNSEMLESARTTIRGFTSGILILLTTLYVYRRVPQVVKGAE